MNKRIKKKKAKQFRIFIEKNIDIDFSLPRHSDDFKEHLKQYERDAYNSVIYNDTFLKKSVAAIGTEALILSSVTE